MLKKKTRRRSTNRLAKGGGDRFDRSYTILRMRSPKNCIKPTHKQRHVPMTHPRVLVNSPLPFKNPSIRNYTVLASIAIARF
jgi:hypothetical protein